MTDNELKELLRIDERRAFAGWDLSCLDSRVQTEPLPWDYQALVLKHLNEEHKLLDMGTGGGEFLIGLGHPHENTCVTEAWEPNVKLCWERLAPLGIGVYQSYDDKPLPFEDNMFDIVTNRHETYDTFEVARVLKPNGFFITQQVGGENNRALTERLRPGQAPLFPNFNREAELPKFISAGFEIEWSGEALTSVRYLDVGAVVYYAKVIEWEYPGFSVENDFPQLRALYDEWLLKGYIESSEHRFIIVARNKK